MQISCQLKFSVIAAILACLGITSYSHAADKPAIAVIVAHEHTIKNFSASELSLIYWRKKTYWADGQPIHPVNLPSDHALRLQFSNVVLGSAPVAQNDYWNGLYFHGISPPHVVYSEEAALRYVSTTKGAIAYVDACKTDESVKVILWITKDQIVTNLPEKLNCNALGD